MKLYEITGVLKQLEDEDDIQVVEDTKELLKYEIESKSDNIGKFISNISSQCDSIKAEEKRLAEKRKALENKEKWLREYIKNFMVENDIKKIETTTHKFSISNSQGKLIVENEDLVDMKYKIIVPEHYEIDNEKLKTALKNGEEVNGAKIEKGFTLRIN